MSFDLQPFSRVAYPIVYSNSLKICQMSQIFLKVREDFLTSEKKYLEQISPFYLNMVPREKIKEKHTIQYAKIVQTDLENSLYTLKLVSTKWDWRHTESSNIGSLK